MKFTKLSLIAFLLCFQTGCSLKSALLGFDDSSSKSPAVDQTPDDDDDDTSTDVAGSFPLGKFAFTSEFKRYIHVSSDGKFVFATFDDKIVVTDSAGEQLYKFTPSVGDVTGLAIDANNKILVTCTDANTPNAIRYLKKYDLDGSNATDLITYNDEDPDPNVSQVGYPQAPFVGSDGSIYVAVLNQIRKYNAAGVLQDTIGTVQSAADGDINGNAEFFVETDGSVYVVDNNSDRLQKFDSSGNFVSKFTWPRQVTNSIPTSLIREADGSFVLAERMGNDGRITKFTSTGVLSWVKDGSERGDTEYPTYDSNDMAITKYNGKYYLGFRDEVVIYNADGSYSARHAKVLSGAAVSLRLDNGKFYVGTSKGIVRFSAAGVKETTFATTRMIYGLAASDTVLYATDPTQAGLIYKYDFDGNLLGTINYGGAGQPIGFAISKDKASLFVGDGTGLFKVNIAAETAAPFGAGTFTIPVGMVTLDDGSIVFMDFNGSASVPKKLNADGTLAAVTFATAGPAAITMSYGLSMDSAGKFYAVDTLGNKVVVFNADGTYSATFSGGNLNQPTHITVDKFDNIFVSDSLNNVVKKIGLDGTVKTE